MYFTNEMTRAVTKADEQWLRQICLALHMLCVANIEEKARNPAWRMTPVNCHSIARLMSLIYKDLEVVDGILFGMQITFSGTEIADMALRTTNHSWLQTPDGAIIDPYPMGIIAASTAVLVPLTGTHFCVHGGNMYREDVRVRMHFDVRRSWKIARAGLRFMRRHADEKTVHEAAQRMM